MTLDRRTFIQSSVALAGAAALIPGLAFAKAPLMGTQVPAYYRFKVGDFEVTALNDGAFELERTLYPKADATEAEQLLDIAYRPRMKLPTAINAYVINTGDKLVLVDTGCAAFFGPVAGKLTANMTAAGLSPEAVDAVFLTHMHPDHAAGLITADGKATFPNAEVVLADKEFTFWTDDAMVSRAPAERKKMFQLAQAAVKPYEGRVRRVSGGEVLPGLEAVSADGHTPGHSMLRVTSGDKRLLIWGDIVHTAALQFARPDWAISFDTDQDQAIATRKRVFDEAASDRVMVAGMHLDFPGVGFVSREKIGYAYHPAFWSPIL